MKTQTLPGERPTLFFGLIYLFIFSIILLVSSPVLAQWNTDSLGSAKAILKSASFPNGVLFFGSWGTSGSTTTADFFNVNTKSHTMLTSPMRISPAFAQSADRFYSAGGQYSVYSFSNSLDIFNSVSCSWSTVTFTNPRVLGAVGAIGNKVFCAGGHDRYTGYFRKVDIYNEQTNTWSTANLSKARDGMIACVAGSKLVFAGGCVINNSTGAYTPLKNVDIYDATLNTWSTANLSVARLDMASAIAGNKIIFAGGDAYNAAGTQVAKSTVDIYNSSTNLWTTASLPVGRYYIQSAVAGNKVYFVGGTQTNFTEYAKMDALDLTTNTWTTYNLPANLLNYNVTSDGSRIYVAGGMVNGSSTFVNTVYVFNTTTNTWSTMYLSQPRIYLQSALAGGQLFFAGGYSAYTGAYIPTNRVDILNTTILKFASPVEFESSAPVSSAPSLEVFPNPCKDRITILSGTIEFPAKVQLYDLDGRETNELWIDTPEQPVELSGMKSGIYLLRLTDAQGQNVTKRLIKE